MYKTLIKKQLLELFENLFANQASLNNKKKKKKSRGSQIAGMAFLYFLLVFICFYLAFMMAGSFIPAGLDWFFFAIFGLSGLAMSIFINVFMAHSMLFKSKDNTLLLSLPVTPQAVLLSRIVVLLVNCFIVGAFLWLPAIIAYIVVAQFSAIVFISNIVMGIAISLVSILFSCLIGFIIAKTVKNKNLQIILSILGFALLAILIAGFQFGPGTHMPEFIESIKSAGPSIQESVPILYFFGRACCGDIVLMLSIFGVVSALAALMFFILSKTFIGIITNESTAKYKEYKNKNHKSSRPILALLKKEITFFFKTPAYVFNAGAGVMVFIVIAFMGFMRMDTINNYMQHLQTINPADLPSPLFNASDVLLLAFTGISFLAAALNTLTTPSVSLEGKSVWILRSLPVRSFEVFKSKILLGVIYSTVTGAIFTLVACILLGVNPVFVLIVALATAVFSALSSSFGLLLGIRRANFD